jgi:hypothetical protein
MLPRYLRRAVASMILALPCGALAQAEEPAAAPSAATAASVAMNVDNPALLKGIKRVAIAGFTVDIVEHMEATADIAGAELLTGAPSDVSITLVGIDKTHYQAMVDAMYDKVAADLKAQGFEVMEHSELVANPEFQKIQSANSGEAREVKSPAGTNDYYSARGLPMLLVDEGALISKPMFAKHERDPYLSMGAALAGAFSMRGLYQLGELGKSLNVSMITVRVTLLGGQAKIDKAFWKTAASGSVDAAMAYVPLYNRILVLDGTSDKARVSLKEQTGTAKVGELVNVTSTEHKAAETAGNVAIAAGRALSAFGVLRGVPANSIKYNNSVRYEIRLEQAPFEKAVGDSFAKVSEGLAAELAHSRG